MTPLDQHQEEIASSIAKMTDDQVKSEIMDFEGRFKLDFSKDFLDGLPVERLRHILLAAKIQLCRVH